MSNTRVGVFADVANLYRNGGVRAQYDRLREFACRDGAEGMRLNAYVTFDESRAERDHAYRTGAASFHNKLRDYGYKCIVKPVKWFQDGSGNRVGKANADMDLAVDCLLQSQKLDRVLIASGDGDFVKLARALQNQGCRVEVVALDNTAISLREEADQFIPGYLIPGFIPVDDLGPDRVPWGDVGSRLTGWVYWNEHNNGRAFGYMRYLKEIAPGLWYTDARDPDSPWGTAYFHNSNLPRDVDPRMLPSRNFIFEFTLGESDRGEGFQALEIELVSRLPGQ